jgi:hypothetical protein
MHRNENNTTKKILLELYLIIYELKHINSLQIRISKLKRTKIIMKIKIEMFIYHINNLFYSL